MTAPSTPVSSQPDRATDEQPKIKPFPTGIESLDKLLPGKQGGGIARLEKNGFFGVIFGAAGSGKSILGLQLCCRFAAQEKGRHAVYVTQEPAKLIKAKATLDFKFHLARAASETDVSVIDDGHVTAVWNRGQSTLTIVSLPLDSPNQKAKLVNLFQLLNGHFCRTDKLKKEGLDPKETLLVCVDNAETITGEAYADLVGATFAKDEFEGGRDKSLYKHLRAWCAQHRLNTWFAFEEAEAQNAADEDTRIATTAQAYAADIVVRLGLTVFATGYRERSLEIVKAKNQGYRRGRHHFSIHGWSEEDADAPTGIIVYPSLPSQLHVLGGKPDPGGVASDDPEPQTPPAKRLGHRLGLTEVDWAVWKKNRGADEKESPRKDWGYLAPGTVSVLVSDLDPLASEIALHFALQDERPALYLSLLHPEEELRRMLRKYSFLRGKKGKFECRHFAPEHISEGKLLQDIQNAISKAGHGKGACRVVVDNVFALESKFPLICSEKHFLTALFQLFRTMKVTALVVDMVEVGEGRNPLEKSFAAGLVGDVFLLRHVEFQSHTSKVFSVLELAAYHEPQELWEIESTKERIVAKDKFEFFKGVLSGQPEPVQITLSLYADSPGSPLHLYLMAERKVLRQTFGQNIEIHTCHPADYVALQQNVATGDILALGDCHIISIDEIWLEDLLDKDLLEPLDPGFFGKRGGDWAHDRYVTAAHDLVFRARGKTENLKKHLQGRRYWAIPDRNNCGILAYNPACWNLLAAAQATAESDLVKKCAVWIEKINRDGRGKPNKTPALKTIRDASCLNWSPFSVTWNDLIRLQTVFVQSLAKDRVDAQHGDPAPWSSYRTQEPDPGLIRQVTGRRETPTNGKAWGVFTFSMENRESCVSFLLELVLSVLPSRDACDLVDEKGQLKWKGGAHKRLTRTTGRSTAWTAGLVRLLELLDPWDIHRLADVWFRPSQTERPCVFSRQWFSSWGVIGLRSPGLVVMELPRGEAGQPTPVSGAWYLGILRGGTALQAGARLIKRLTSPTEELHRLNYGIGLPVRRALFDAPNSLEAIPPLPYRERFRQIARVQSSRLKSSDRYFDANVIRSVCPFYRLRIRHYSQVSPLLMGLITSTARAALASRFRAWLVERNEPFPKALAAEIESLVEKAAKRYREIVPY